MLDLLILNGRIIDGSGNPGYYGAVGVEGDILHILRGDVSSVQAGRFIDAAGHVVSPGFIDVHSHGGLTIIGEPRHEPKVRQGITTELVGIDGNSAAPFKNPRRASSFYRVGPGPQRRSSHAGRLAQRGRVSLYRGPKSGGEHRLHLGQLPASYLVRGLERPPGHRS